MSSATYERIELLDVLRGFALLGVFVVNSQFMAMPLSEALQAPQADTLEFGAWFAVQALFLSKFVGIFSLLFEAGFALQSQRARERGRPFAASYLWRSILLGVLGLAHGLLLFEGDILLPYAVASVILLLFRRLEPRGLALAAALCLGLAALSSARVTSLAGLEELAGAALDSDPSEELAVHRDGPLGALLAARAGSYLGWLVLSSLLGFNWRILGAFFLGAWLLRQGFFTRAPSVGTRRLALASLVVGLGFECAWTALDHVSRATGVSALTAGARELTSLVLAFGYMALVRELVNRGTPGEGGLVLRTLDRIAHWMSCTGRIALTSYLSQSLLANLFFTFLGLAWYAQLDRSRVLLLVLLTYSAQLAFSVYWTRRFRAGPIEWIWRSAIRFKALPLRR